MNPLYTNVELNHQKAGLGEQFSVGLPTLVLSDTHSITVATGLNYP